MLCAIKGSGLQAGKSGLFTPLPVILGNIAGGMLFAGMALYITARKKAAAAEYQDNRV